MKLRPLLLATALGALPVPLTAQSLARPPVIDVHLHAPMSPGSLDEVRPRLEGVLAAIDTFNVRYVMLTGVPDVLFDWHEQLRHHVGVLPGLLFPCENGLNVMWGRPCFDHGGDWPDIDRLRADIEAGHVQALGEITTQFHGLSPSDPAFEPYLALAEEYDLPVFIHMGPGYPGGAYETTEATLPTPRYRASVASPLLLEAALLRHPGVRVAVVHSGWPFADEMVSLLYHHPQVYAEVGLLQTSSIFPRAEYYAFLERIVRAGFADRILFGSDASIREGVTAILDADFLTEDEKRDILCGNAARFLRLAEETCQ